MSLSWPQKLFSGLLLVLWLVLMLFIQLGGFH